MRYTQDGDWSDNNDWSYNLNTDPNQWDRQTQTQTQDRTTDPQANSAPQTVSWTGDRKQGVLDNWLNFARDNFSTGQQTRPGFYASSGNYRNNLQSVVDAWNNAHPDTRASVAGDDKIDFGFGPIDVLTTNNEWWYNNAGLPSAGGAPAGGGGASAPAPVGPGGAGSSASVNASANSARPPEWDALYQQLLARSKQGLTVDPNDPVIKGQVDAYRAEQTRAMRNGLADMAESTAPQAAGSLVGQARLAAQNAGSATSGFQAQLMQKELQAKRDEIAQALDGMRGMLTADEQAQLQLQLDSYDNALKKYGIDVSADTTRYNIDTSNDQFLRNLALNQWDRSNYWDWTRSGGNG